MYDCIHNALYNNKITVKSKKKLKKLLLPKKRLLESIARGKGKTNFKRKKLLQIGGGLFGPILEAVSPLMHISKE
jgi:hypothetical protein